jgi:heme exporter protein C
MTTTSAPSRQAVGPVLDWFFWLSALLMTATYVRAIWFTPADLLQGPTQKIFYMHIGSVMGGYVATGILVVTSIIHLWLKDERTDWMAAAAAEVSLVCYTLVLVAGSIYAKVIWGAWWVWELRLTLTLLLWFLVLGYLVMRQAIEEPAMRARFCAVLAILQGLLIPFIHLAVYIVPDHMHPMPVALKPSKPSMSPEMLITFLMAIVAFMLIAVALIRARYRVTQLREQVAELEMAEAT